MVIRRKTSAGAPTSLTWGEMAIDNDTGTDAANVWVGKQDGSVKQFVTLDANGMLTINGTASNHALSIVANATGNGACMVTTSTTGAALCITSTSSGANTGALVCIHQPGTNGVGLCITSVSSNSALVINNPNGTSICTGGVVISRSSLGRLVNCGPTIYPQISCTLSTNGAQTLTWDNASFYYVTKTGTGVKTITLGDSLLEEIGSVIFIRIDNSSTNSITFKDSSATTIDTFATGAGGTYMYLKVNNANWVRSAVFTAT